MHRFSIIMVLLVSGAASLGCGGNEATQKAIRQSERYYEAASIAWFEERDVLAAIRNLTRAVETNPQNDDAHYLLGIIRLGRLELETAETHLREALRLRQGGDPAGLSGVQNNLGVVLIHQKRYEEASGCSRAPPKR
jgi:Tfp pilus assembly protein PilF